MANYGFDDLTLTIDDSSGDPQNISAYVYEIGALGVEAVLEDSHTAGDSWVEKLFVGLKKASEFTISGAYDDTATVGPQALMDSIGSTRTFLFTWGSTKTSSMDCIIKKWDRAASRGALTRFTATLQPTSTVTEV